MLLVYLVASWTLGIVLARFLWGQGIIGCNLPVLWMWGAAAATLIAAAILLRRQRRVRLVLVLLLFALLGAWRYQSHPLKPCFTASDLAFHNGADDVPTWATVVGIIDDYPDLRDRSANYRLQARTLEIDGANHNISGSLLLQTSRYPEFQYGDEVRVTGRLQTPPWLDDFCYREYLARQGIHSLIKYPKSVELLAHGEGSRFWATLNAFRSRASRTINRILPEPQASLLNGILLGIETGIPRDLYDDFNATGTSHIIVISGFNARQTAYAWSTRRGLSAHAQCACRRPSHQMPGGSQCREQRSP
jgi:competence protein ComEC